MSNSCDYFSLQVKSVERITRKCSSNQISNRCGGKYFFSHITFKMSTSTCMDFSLILLEVTFLAEVHGHVYLGLV